MFLETTYIAIFLSIPLCWLMFCWNAKPKVLVYMQPGRWYWLKRLVFFLIYHVRSLQFRNRKRNSGLTALNTGMFELSGSEDGMKGYGRAENYEVMERPQQLKDGPFAIDCCFFGGTDKNGTKISCRLARRHQGYAEIWLFLEVPGIGCLQHPAHPDTHVYYTHESGFKAGGMTLEVLEPNRRWRVSFSGKLRRGLCNAITDKPQEYVEVSFSFIWSAFSQPFSFDTDMACCMLGDGISREVWTKSFFKRLERNHQSHYEQWGELRGRLCVEGQEDRTLYLQCVRDHTFGERNWNDLHRYIIHFIYMETGMSIQVGIVSQPNLMSHLKLGYVSYANGDIVSVTDVSLELWKVGESPPKNDNDANNTLPPQSYSFSFRADGIEYEVEVEGGTTPVWYHHEDRGGKVMEMFSKFKVNSKPGRGIAEFFYRNTEGPSFTPPPFVPTIAQPSTDVIEASQEKLALPFFSPACQSPVLVGGKGAQLAQLTSLQQEVKATVPQGFCLTLQAFQLQLKTNPSLEKAINTITQHCVSSLDNLPSACAACVDLITNTDVCPEVREAILDSLRQLETGGADYSQCHFAVRSSAAGEDGEEASSAGQMDTFLGVVGLDKIMLSVRQCWSSAYSHQAVEYRRQHGQPIQAMVGVVLQEMVPAHAAGVLFTADPISGSCSRLVINANFGLGESVVSGRSDPDTVVVDRHPEVLGWGVLAERLTIGSVTVGQKQMQIVEDENGGIREESNPNTSSSSCSSNSLSVSEDIILKLARLGVELEKRFGSPRDIEWAVVKEDVYLLQCRPITVASSETEEDFIHEFDSPMGCDYPWNTTGNISEMMPGAITPLTMSTFMRSIEYALQFMNQHAGGRKSPTHLSKALPAFCNHLFISLIDIASMFVTTALVRKDTMEVSLLGSLLPELRVGEAEDYYGRREGVIRRGLNFIGLIRVGSKAGVKSAEWEKRIVGYTVGEGAGTARELYRCIHASLPDYMEVWLWTLINSSRSGNWSGIIMSILCENASEWTNVQFGDMALLLSKCQDVYSAEVPHAFERIAREICSVQPSIADEFLNTPDEDCLRMLRDHPSVDALVESFLLRHGHRCLRESELREKSWRSAPEKCISVLKAMVKARSFERDTSEAPVNITHLLDQMKSKPTAFKRLLLRLLLPKAWAAVGAREWGKSISIQMSEIFKIAYSRLSTLMHEEGRLPDPDLMYFLTHQELGALLTSSSSAKLITRAQKRRKVLVKQQEFKFDKITRGRPVPISMKPTRTHTDSSTAASRCLKGMPVSQGCASGSARVVHSLDQASVIQCGDILVVTSTDIGWSPYFPLIGGLVTELGGLISHGAVVAREYGIPCVVNVPNATSMLISGELIKIDGRQGIITQLKD